MRILFLNQFFWPDTAATGQLLSDLAVHLANSGETVDVICGSANYGGQNSSPRPNVGITRLSNTGWPTRIAGRVGSYLSFLCGSLWRGVRHGRPDVVVTLTTPPLLSLVGLAIQRLRGARHIIWEMDVYPDVAVELGVLRPNGFFTRIFGWLSDLPRRKADRVIVLGECMKERLIGRGIPADIIYVAENWADCDAAANRIQPLPQAGFSVLYSGNLGVAHDVETIAGAISALNGGNFRFVFAGGGSRQKWLRDFCEAHHLNDAQFMPYCEREELGARLASGHVGLVTQQASSIGTVVPSKTYGILAAGRPILFIGPKQSTTARIIERYGCGWHIECGDVDGLVKLLRLLHERTDLVEAAGARAYGAFVSQYQRSLGVSRLAVLLQPGLKARSAAASQGGALKRGMAQGSRL